MPRNYIPGQVEWTRVGAAVEAFALELIRQRGPHRYMAETARHFASEGVTASRFNMYLRNVTDWKERRDRAIAEFEAAQRGEKLPPLLPKAPPLPPPLPPPDPVEIERQRQEQKRQLRQERELLTAVAGEKSLRAFLTTLAENTVPRIPPPSPYKPVPQPKGVTTESIVMQWSDWHAYELVSDERTRGFNRYDSAVFGQRVKALVEAHTSIKRRMERGGGWHFPRCVIGLNGDFVSGTIHEAERHSDAPNIVLAVYGAASVLAHAIRDVAAEYETVECYATTGNHGRFPDAKRMQQKDPLRSWDALIAILAREMLRDVKNVTVEIPDAYSVAFDVEGWTFLQTHGHDIKSWNSIPHYGIGRFVGNINALEASRGRQVHYYLFGHFHTPSSLEHASGESFVNGSLIGGTEYGINTLGKSGPPVQWMLGVHPEHGVTHRWPLLGRTAVRPTGEGYASTPWLKSA